MSDFNSLDLTMIRLMKHREFYDMYHRGIPAGALDKPAEAIIKGYGKFFSENPDAKVATPDAYFPYFKLLHPKLKPEGEAILKRMIGLSADDVPAEVSAGILSRLADAAYALEVTTMLERYNAGDEVSVVHTIRALADKAPVGGDAIPYANTDIAAMLAEDENDWGFKWRLDCMNKHIRPLRGGDFGIIGARVDRGKTTWLASELTCMAKQVRDLFGADRPIVYLNNEGPGGRIVKRMYQAALGVDNNKLVELSREGTLRQQYLDAVGGWDSIQVIDVHDRPMSFLEQVVKRLNPSVVVYDMLDVVPFDGNMMNGGTRTDQILEAAYQRARIMSVKYDHAAIATSQLSAEAEGNAYPTLAMLSNSKTGKPGAADWVAMLGSSADPLMDDTRWISLPKNKLQRPGVSKDPRQQVIFDGNIARVSNPINL